MCHSWFLVYLRVPLRRPHLLGHHLHHRIPYLTEGDPPKIQYPKEVKVRVRSYGETCRKKPTETRSRNKMKDAKKHKAIYLHDLPDWLQVFKENLVDESSPSDPRGNPAPKDQDTAGSSHELQKESRAKVEPRSGKHIVYTHFPNNPHCDICLSTKITRASCRRRAGTVVPRTDTFGDWVTADHKILSEESESRHNHRYAVVVQDLATQWLQSYPCKTKTSQETQKSLKKFLEPTRKLASLVRNYPRIIVRLHHADQKHMGLQREQCAEQRKALLLYCRNQV